MFAKRLAPIAVVLLAVLIVPFAPSPAAAATRVVSADIVRNAPVVSPLTTPVATAATPVVEFAAGDIWQGPGLSGDGNWAAFWSEGGGSMRLHRVNLTSSQSAVAATHSAGSGPVLSADGSRIAYVATPPGQTDFAAYLWDGSNNTSIRLSATNAAVHLNARSPISISDDGTRVVWVEATPSGQNLAIWTSGSRTDIGGVGSTAKLSGNGRYVFYEKSGRSIRQDLATGAKGDIDFVGQVSNDGSQIGGAGYYFDNQENDLGWAVEVRDWNGTNQLLIQNPYASLTPTMRMAGNGSAVMMKPTVLTGPENGINHVRVDVATGQPYKVSVPLAGHTSMIGLSDDGSISLISGEGQLWKVDHTKVAPPTVIVADLVQPQLSDQIVRLYHTVFLRAPKPAATDFWGRQRAAGVSIVEVAAEFVAATEFQNRYENLDESEFVNLIYNNVLGRPPEPAGFNHWLSQLTAGLTRAEMVVGFSDSNEFVRRTGTAKLSPPEAAKIFRLYKAYFLRTPDKEGFDFWFAQHWNGLPLASISDAMAGSTEFQNRYGSLSDAQFVDRVYQNVLGRAPQPEGREFWQFQMSQGMTRGQVMIGFSDSAEFIRRTDTLPPR